MVPKRPALAAALCFAALLASPAPASAGAPAGAPATSPSREADVQSILRRLAEAFPPSATAALSVRDAATDEVLVDRDGQRAVKPASTAKLVTSMALLEALGADWRFETRLEATGSLSGGRLTGDLVVVGSGDPSLGDGEVEGGLDRAAVLARWVAAVHAAGIREVTGDVVGDDACLDDLRQPRYAVFEDVANYYGATTSGLAFARNEYTVVLSSGSKVGAPTKVLAVEPHTGVKEHDNRVRVGLPGSGDKAYFLLVPDQPRRLIVGTVPPERPRFPIKGALPDPAATCAACLREALAAASIRVGGRARGLASSGRPLARGTRRVLDRLPSPPLAALLRFQNLTSNNCYAEQLLKVLGRRRGDGRDDAAAGALAVRAFLERRGVAAPGWSLRDGSGLSHYDAMPPDALARLLALATRDPALAPLAATLPVAGRDKALLRRVTSPELSDRLQAKTGYQEGGYGLAGYLTTRTGRRLAFAFVVANHGLDSATVSRAFEDVALTLLGW